MTVETIAPSAFVTSAARPRVRRSARMSPVTFAAALVAIIALLPLGFIAWVTISIGWDASAPLIFRGRVAELLLNTLLLVALSVPISIALSVALAWLTERTDLPGARWWGWLMVAPLAVPAFVHSYAWVSAIPSFNGL